MMYSPTNLPRIHNHIKHQKHRGFQPIQITPESIQLRLHGNEPDSLRRSTKNPLSRILPRILNRTPNLLEDTPAFLQDLVGRVQCAGGIQLPLAVVLEAVAQMTQDATRQGDLVRQSLDVLVCVLDFVADRPQLDGELRTEVGDLEDAGCYAGKLEARHASGCLQFRDMGGAEESESVDAIMGGWGQMMLIDGLGSVTSRKLAVWF